MWCLCGGRCGGGASTERSRLETEKKSHVIAITVITVITNICGELSQRTLGGGPLSTSLCVGAQKMLIFGKGLGKHCYGSAIWKITLRPHY